MGQGNQGEDGRFKAYEVDRGLLEVFKGQEHDSLVLDYEDEVDH